MGEFWNVSKEEYDEDRELLRSSALKLILSDPAAYYRRYIEGETESPSLDLVLGNLVHHYILLGEQGWEIYRGNGSTRSKEFREEKAQVWLESGRYLIPEKSDSATAISHDRIMAMVDAVNGNPIAAKLLARGYKEQAIRFEYRGVPSKARLDTLCYDGAIPDLKTTRHDSLNDFARDIWNFGHHISAVWYELARSSLEEMEGMKAPFYWVVVSKSEHPRCWVAEMSEEKREWGREKVDDAIKILMRCRETGVWKSPDELCITQL